MQTSANTASPRSATLYIAMLLAVASSIGISFGAHIGALLFTDPTLAMAARHLAWVTPACCALVGLVLLRNYKRMITAGSLCLISAVAGVVFGVLPWIDLPLIPAPQEIARVERPGNHLVGYQIHSLYKPSEVLVCEEILLVEGVYWNDIHIRMHHAVDMQFAATGEQTWSCSFQHLHPGRSVRSRTLTLPQ